MGNCLMAGQGQAPARQADAEGRPAAVGRRRDAEQDVRQRHARDDVRARHAGRRLRLRGGRRRHGEHEQRAAPDVRAQGRALRRRAAVRPHGDGRPGRRLRARQGDGRVRRKLRRPSTASRARRRTSSRSPRRSAPRPPTKTAASTGRWRRSRWQARAATRWSSSTMGRITHVKTGDQTGADPERVAAAAERLELVYVEMKPGDALFFHANLLHRSDQNRSPNDRWALVCCYNCSQQ